MADEDAQFGRGGETTGFGEESEGSGGEGEGARVVTEDEGKKGGFS